MLALAGHNQFHGSIDNYGSTYTDAGFGTSVPAHASANVKGAATQLIAGASVTEDCYGIIISACGGSVSGVTNSFLADLLIDPAGGTSWSTLIANVLMLNPSFIRGHYRYFFPIWLKNGTSIGMQQQCSTAAQAVRIGVKLLTKPSRPELVKVGYKVESYGADTSTSRGAAITIGNAALGGWTSVGTTAGKPWFWQAGLASNDTSLNVGGLRLDIAAGDGTNKRIAAEGIAYNTDVAEGVGKAEFGEYYPLLQAVASETVYVRATAPGASDTTNTACAYGVI